jgi:vancomycin resistance protein YoaR
MRDRLIFFKHLALLSFLLSSSFIHSLYAAPASTSTLSESVSLFRNNATTTYELIGVATTSIKGSSKERKENIVLGLKRINNKIIQPGEEFSLIAALRPFSKEAGFKEEHVISTSSSPMELGGGLCQVSTTLFRSTLKAGLPITKRQSHSYVVGYYGAGLDATVYFPKTDFRFVNNYDNEILVRAALKGMSAEIAMYGTKDGRVATTSAVVVKKVFPKPTPKLFYTTELAVGEKKCTETARKGMNTSVVYTVTNGFGVSASTTFLSYYRPWAEVCYSGITEEEKRKREIASSSISRL